MAAFALFVRPKGALAGTLLLSPGTNTYAVGDKIQTTFNINSSDKAANAVSAVISYPKDLLDLTAISESGSVVNAWVSKPTDLSGRVRVEGVILNPGYIGGNGKVLTLTFRAKAAGSAKVALSDAQLLANDGEGTNILSGTRSATYTVKAATPAEPHKPATTTAPVAETAVPFTIPLGSPTHPDENAWYRNTQPTLVWPLPSAVTAINLSVDHDPGVSSTTWTNATHGPISTYTYAPFADGVWHAHLRAKFGKEWNVPSSLRLQIDTQPPADVRIEELSVPSARRGVAAFAIEATDAASGIERYEIQLDQEPVFIDHTSSASIRFETPALAPGTHTLLINVFDRAGNATARATSFSIKADTAPILTDVPTPLAVNDYLVVKGTAGPNLLITLQAVAEDGRTYTGVTQSDEHGLFTGVIKDRLEAGSYRVVALSTDASHASRQSSEAAIVIVSAKRWPGIDARLTFANVVALLAIVISIASLTYTIIRRRTQINRTKQA